jgi:probable addiction module antidote protein
MHRVWIRRIDAQFRECQHLKVSWTINMAVKKRTTYDPAEDLTSDKAIALFMAEALQTNDAGYVAHALGVVIRAKDIVQIAERTGLSREQLYRSFSAKGNPTLKTTLAVLKAVGIDLTTKVSITRRQLTLLSHSRLGEGVSVQTRRLWRVTS